MGQRTRRLGATLAIFILILSVSTTAQASTAPAAAQVISPAAAVAVVDAMWPQREQALAGDDQAVTDRLETGVAREYDDAITADDLGLHERSLRIVRPHGPVRVFVPPETGYPADFLAEVETSEYETPSVQWTEMMIFTEAAPGAPWLLAFDTGYAGPLVQEPVRTAGGLDAAAPKLGWIAPASVGPMLASYWQHWKDDRSPPPGTVFAPGYWTTEHGRNDIATTKQGGVSSDCGCRRWVTYRSDARDGVYQFAFTPTAGYPLLDLVCSTVRYSDVARPLAGQTLYQNPARTNWGGTLPPGNYSSITSEGLRQTCVIASPSQGVALQVAAANGGFTYLHDSRVNALGVLVGFPAWMAGAAALAGAIVVVVAAAIATRRRRAAYPRPPGGTWPAGPPGGTWPGGPPGGTWPGGPPGGTWPAGPPGGTWPAPPAWPPPTLAPPPPPEAPPWPGGADGHDLGGPPPPSDR